MQRGTLFLTSTVTLGGLVACGELPDARLFDYWESLGATGDSSGTDDTGSSGGADSGAGDGDGKSGDGDSDDADSDDGGGDGDGDSDPDAEEDGGSCEPVSTAVDLLELPADIIFIVDNSFSMLQEAVFVQTQMNGFSAQLEMSEVDHHIILISSYPANGNGNGNGSGICIDPPLGSGNCPNYDNNLPSYHHVDEKVGSNNALAKLIATQSEWKLSIRPDSMKHIVVVSDDDSDIGAIPFSNLFKALDPSYDPFVVHAIVCPWECPEIGDIGHNYLDLVEQTGGVLGNLCAQDFEKVFDDLAKAVIQDVPLSCQFEIPPTPTGMNFDPDLLNVELDDGNGNLEALPRVDDLADCVTDPESWYYDPPVNPVRIRLCPQTCAKVQEYAMVSVNVKFGCESLNPE